MAPSGISVDLNADQLRRLAKLIYYQEVESIKDIKFHSEPELAKYLRDCKSSYQTVTNILDAGGDIKDDYKDDQTKGSIAHDAYEYVLKGVNLGLQSFRNFTLRLNFLTQIKDHTFDIKNGLKMLDPENLINVRRMAQEALDFKNAMLDYTRKYQSLISKITSGYINFFKESGQTLEQLIQRYQIELGFLGPFKDLTKGQKIQVYNRIIEACGLGKTSMTAFEVISGAAGLVVLLITAGMIVWDIYTSEDKIQTASKDAVMVLSSVAGTMFGTTVAATLEVELVGLVEVSSIVLSVTGFVVGILAGAILAAIGLFVIDLIFNPGASPPQNHYVPPTDGHRCYVAEMPNGAALARQLLHQD